MTRPRTASRPRRVAGGLFVLGALAFAVAATVLSGAVGWPKILREPPKVVLPAFAAGGPGLMWIWFATAWTYGILLVPILLLPAALGRQEDPVLRAATWVGAGSWSSPASPWLLHDGHGLFLPLPSTPGHLPEPAAERTTRIMAARCGSP